MSIKFAPLFYHKTGASITYLLIYIMILKIMVNVVLIMVLIPVLIAISNMFRDK